MQLRAGLEGGAKVSTVLQAANDGIGRGAGADRSPLGC